MFELIKTFHAHSSYVLGLAFTPDNNTLISTGMDNLVKYWKLPSYELLKTLEKHSKSVNSISIAPDGLRFATSSTEFNDSIL